LQLVHIKRLQQRGKSIQWMKQRPWRWNQGKVLGFDVEAREAY
jgi:hypothetical protein